MTLAEVLPDAWQLSASTTDRVNLNLVAISLDRTM